MWLVLVVTLAGCGTEPSPDIAVIGIEGNPTTLDPRFALDAYSTRILPLIFDRVLEPGPDGSPRPGLATAWEIENDTIYRFRIREGVTFSDGSPLGAGVIAANLDHLRDPANGCPAGAGLEVIDSVDAPDDTTLVVRLARPFAPFLQKLIRPVIPEAGLRDKEFGRRPIGSGPYAVSKIEAGRVIELHRNERYRGPAPAIRALRFEILPNETTRMLKMRNGELDLLVNAAPPYSLRYFSEQPGLVVERGRGINYSYLGFNLADPAGITSRAEVRRAIAAAVDRDAIIRSLLAGQARKADSLLAPENWAHEAAGGAEYDPEAARRLLDEAGFPDPDGDGPAPRFKLSYKTSTDRLRNRIGDVIAGQLAAVGIAVEKRSFEWGVFFDDVKKGNFQMFSLTWVGVTDPDHLHYVFHSSSMPPTGGNRGRFQSARVDGLLERARAVPDLAQRAEAYREVQRIVADEAVYVDLWWADDIVVRSRRLEGFVPVPGGEMTSLASARLVDGPL